MFHRKKHKSLMDMDIGLTSVLKAVAVGTVIYQAAKFMINELADD
ncbi:MULTISPECIES: hypothetical protein [Sporomusa]|jgi:hypothetical protein|uniref:Uncharacterized protein n=2 Tax=Sporomusa TaxID=2375 RepID=A0ABP2CBS1_9FIRM|nr:MULTISPECIES: hypothetical protein [Sporomusa]OLS56256.1 hypothetical protein SPSPH_26470 [Sporomusa sphaeroides DSM 2875]CVK21748.1 hypothetical protein SSPH_04457 [Sporomusa sphaeroides DSM 2875]SCM82471.1 conserved hypothetical protein [uncultured Sporomusa sp.]HML33929.1 hypothetical protein [Sporomusa sphaeroides]